jgi:hypothetical protein
MRIRGEEKPDICQSTSCDKPCCSRRNFNESLVDSMNTAMLSGLCLCDWFWEDGCTI